MTVKIWGLRGVNQGCDCIGNDTRYWMGWLAAVGIGRIYPDRRYPFMQGGPFVICGRPCSQTGKLLGSMTEE